MKPGKSKQMEVDSQSLPGKRDDEDVVITVQGTGKLGDWWAEFIAQEVARALDNLEAFGVSKAGDFGCVNSEEERADRFKQLVRASRARVGVFVQARSSE